MKLTTILPLIVLSLPAFAGGEQNVLVQLGADAHDIEYDELRSRVYITIPSQNKLTVVSTNTWEIETEVAVAPTPQGVALSLDGTRLFVAKRGAGAVAVIDPDTWTQSDILLTDELGDPRTYDVIEGQPDRLYVSANPSSNGFAWIVQVELDNGNSASRVASNTIIRCAPTFEGTADFMSLYVGACFSPNSLYKLDLTQPTAPIVAEDDHGSVGGTYHVESNPDASRVFLAGGQIVDGDTLDVVGQIGGGISRFDVDPTRLFVAVSPNQIQTWNVNTQTQVDARTLPCSFSSPRELLVLPQETGFLVLSGSQLCGVADVVPCEILVEPTCATAPNSVGSGALISTFGEPRIAQNEFGLSINAAPPEQYCIFMYSSESAQLPFGDGWLCVSPFAGIQRLTPSLQLDSIGNARMELDFQSPPLLTGPITAYSTWYFQAWYRDALGPGGTGVNTSNAVCVTFCP